DDAAVVEECVEIGQGAADGAPGGRLPDGCAPARGCDTYGRPEGGLGQRIQAASLPDLRDRARLRALRTLALPFAQHGALHLAGRRHRQLVDELDLLRVFVGRELAAHVLLQRVDQLVAGELPCCEL